MFLEVVDVKKPALEGILQQILGGLQVDAGNFHAHQLDLERGQPVPKL